MQRPLALITGTSSGFGLSAAVALAQHGYQVAATMRSLDKRDALLTAAKAVGVADYVSIMRLDVTEEQSIQIVVADLIGKYGRIDLLLNNAGFAAGGPVEEVSMEEWRRQFDTNFFGTVAVTKAVLPYMRQQRSGTIMNISSISGQLGFPAMGPYSASKFAVEGFSESLRLEMLPFGVKVVLIEPGAYKTEIWDKGLGALNLAPQSPYAFLLRWLERQVAKIVQSAGEPQEVVDVILKAAKSTSPKLRYPVGKGVRTSTLLKSLLPWRLVENSVKKRLPAVVSSIEEQAAEGK